MDKTYLKVIILIFLIAVFPNLQAQDDANIDASKPTNFYSFLDNTLEYSSRPNENVIGYRGKITLTPSEAHLILGEVPLLYNDRTEKFGLGDLRVRYFWLPYKNYDKFVGAFGPSVDVFMPTGSFVNGLGSSRWVVSPGITMGLMATDWIQFFPILSYQYASRPTGDGIPESAKNETNGFTFQVITPIVFSDVFFIQITPIYRANNFNYEKIDRYIQEIFAAYSLKKKLQLTTFYSGNFTDEVDTISLGLTAFL